VSLSLPSRILHKTWWWMGTCLTWADSCRSHPNCCLGSCLRCWWSCCWSWWQWLGRTRWSTSRLCDHQPPQSLTMKGWDTRTSLRVRRAYSLWTRGGLDVGPPRCNMLRLPRCQEWCRRLTRDSSQIRCRLNQRQRNSTCRCRWMRHNLIVRSNRLHWPWGPSATEAG